jgi:hypothetical protein
VPSFSKLYVVSQSGIFEGALLKHILAGILAGVHVPHPTSGKGLLFELISLVTDPQQMKSGLQLWHNLPS